jgi:chromosome segregation ATPase
MTATGIEQATSSSYAQTEVFFIQHADYLMPRVHQMRTDLAQYYNATKPSARLTYTTSADEKVNFQINGTDLLMRDLNIFCSTTANHRAVLEQLKQMAMQNNTTGASIYDLGKIVQSDSIAELNNALKSSEDKQTQLKQQEMQQQQQMQEQQTKSQQEIEKMKIDAQAAEKEKDRQRDILVAEIRAAGYGSMADVNKNEMSDYADQMKEIRSSEQYQEQTSLQREKQVNENMRQSQKMDIEREKLQAQKEIADKQLQIARENKNKFDNKNKNKEKE